MTGKYPFHEKMADIPENERQALGDFLLWLHSGDYTICVEKVYEGRDGPMSEFVDAFPYDHGTKLINKILGLYYMIDYDGLQREKEQMYQELRVRNTLADIEKIGEEDH